MRRGVVGFAIALVFGSLLGIAVSQWKVLRAGVGSMITGLQTMPSIAWFPLAILLFGLTENAIYFVIILGAAPSIANGIISGIDEVPPNLLRAGHMLGARASTATATSSSRRRFLRTSQGSSRAGPSPGGACWPASCWSTCRACHLWVAT